MIDNPNNKITYSVYKASFLYDYNSDTFNKKTGLFCKSTYLEAIINVFKAMRFPTGDKSVIKIIVKNNMEINFTLRENYLILIDSLAKENCNNVHYIDSIYRLVLDTRNLPKMGRTKCLSTK
jgi:hypothetical protein